MKAFSSFVVFFLFTLQVLSQGNSVVISGIVRDGNDRQPLPFVTVQIIQLPDSNFVTGTVTTEQGHFSIGKLG
ncbi:MAG: hypothetical protein V2I46_00720, partial [Bacteroides sp.]|nr:hypothetical protein [Bacteroides sp.]